MNVRIALAVVGTAVAGVLIARGAAMMVPSGPGAAFVQECDDSLNLAADWAIREVEERGQSVGFVQRGKIAYGIPAVCGCARDALKPTMDEHEWSLAGKLAGLQYRVGLAQRANDPQVRAHAEESARREVTQLMSEHKVSLSKVGALSRRVDTALKACFQQNRL